MNGKESCTRQTLHFPLRFRVNLVIVISISIVTTETSVVSSSRVETPRRKQFIQLLDRADDTQREATRGYPWPMLRLDNRSRGEVTRPRRYRRIGEEERAKKSIRTFVKAAGH